MLIAFVLAVRIVTAYEQARVFGSIDLQYYYVDIYIGTPPSRQTVIVDTGSLNTAFPCTGCEACGTHLSRYFTPEKSSTSRRVGCDEGVYCYECYQDQCTYENCYAEGSCISGSYWEDYTYFGDDFDQKVQFKFGCHSQETNLFKTQLADGIMGLSNRLNEQGKETLIDTLYADHDINTDLFALCFAQENGTMTIGGYNSTFHENDVEWVPLIPNYYHYGIQMTSIHIEGIAIEFDTAAGQTIIDSGTTFTYLDNRIYTQFWQVFKDVCQRPGMCVEDTEQNPESNEPCYRQNDLDIDDFLRRFPVIEFDLAGVMLYWKPENYFYRAYAKEKVWCVGVLDNGLMSESVFGAITMRGYDFIFDRNQSRIGFAQADCDYMTTTVSKEFSQLPSKSLGNKQGQVALMWPAFYACIGASAVLLMFVLCYLCCTCRTSSSKKYSHVAKHSLEDPNDSISEIS